jgi:metallo-beta-lactamase family protein
VRIHGEEVNVKARIRAIDAYSGHADRDELVQWARPVLPVLGSALLVHGEPHAIQGLADSLSAAGLERARLLAPELDQAFEIAFMDGRWQAVPSKAAAHARLAAAEASAARDWHNDYAALLLDLRSALRQETDDRRRQELLGEVRRLIDGHRARQASVSKRGSAMPSTV